MHRGFSNETNVALLAPYCIKEVRTARLKLGISRHLAWMTSMLGDDLVYEVLIVVNSNTMPLAWTQGL